MKIIYTIILLLSAFYLSGCSQKLARPVVRIIDNSDTNNTKNIIHKNIKQELFKEYKKYNIKQVSSKKKNIFHYQYEIPNNCKKTVYSGDNINYLPEKTFNTANGYTRLSLYSEARGANQVRIALGEQPLTAEDLFKEKQSDLVNSYKKCTERKNYHFITTIYKYDNAFGVFDVYPNYKDNYIKDVAELFYYTILDNKIYIIRIATTRKHLNDYNHLILKDFKKINLSKELENKLAVQLKNTNYIKDFLPNSYFIKSFRSKNPEIDVYGPLAKVRSFN